MDERELFLREYNLTTRGLHLPFLIGPASRGYWLRTYLSIHTLDAHKTRRSTDSSSAGQKDVQTSPVSSSGGNLVGGSSGLSRHLSSTALTTVASQQRLTLGDRMCCDHEKRDECLVEESSARGKGYCGRASISSTHSTRINLASMVGSSQTKVFSEPTIRLIPKTSARGKNSVSAVERS